MGSRKQKLEKWVWRRTCGSAWWGLRALHPCGLGLTPTLLGAGEPRGLCPRFPAASASAPGSPPGASLLHVLTLSLCQAPGGLWEDRDPVNGELPQPWRRRR